MIAHEDFYCAASDCGRSVAARERVRVGGAALGRSHTRAGLGLSKGLDRVVPEDLLQVRGHLWPAQRQVDRPGEAALGVWIVGAEHEQVIVISRPA